MFPPRRCRLTSQHVSRVSHHPGAEARVVSVAALHRYLCGVKPTAPFVGRPCFPAWGLSWACAVSSEEGVRAGSWGIGPVTEVPAGPAAAHPADSARPARAPQNPGAAREPGVSADASRGLGTGGRAPPLGGRLWAHVFGTGWSWQTRPASKRDGMSWAGGSGGVRVALVELASRRNVLAPCRPFFAQGGGPWTSSSASWAAPWAAPVGAPAQEGWARSHHPDAVSRSAPSSSGHVSPAGQVLHMGLRRTGDLCSGPSHYRGPRSQLGSIKAIKRPSPASAAVGATRLSGRPGQWTWGLSQPAPLCHTHVLLCPGPSHSAPPTVPARLQRVWLMIRSGGLARDCCLLVACVTGQQAGLPSCTVPRPLLLRLPPPRAARGLALPTSLAAGSLFHPGGALGRPGHPAGQHTQHPVRERRDPCEPGPGKGSPWRPAQSGRWGDESGGGPAPRYAAFRYVHRCCGGHTLGSHEWRRLFPSCLHPVRVMEGQGTDGRQGQKG